MIKTGTLHAENGSIWHYKIFPNRRLMQVWNESEDGATGSFSNPLNYSFDQIIDAYARTPRVWGYMYAPIEEFIRFEVTVNTN